MSSINSIGQTNPIQKITAPAVQTADHAAPNAPTRPTDKLELSGLSHLLSSLKTNDVRVDKVAQIKAQIDAGTYETDDKLDVTSDKLLDDLFK